MLSDILHIVLRRYLAAVDADHANSLLSAFAEENQAFFRTDPDINESQVTYEEGSSTITSPSGLEEQDQAYRLDLFSRRGRLRSRNYGKAIKELMEISQCCITKDQVRVSVNEPVMEEVLAEPSDPEFGEIEGILRENEIVEILLSSEARSAFQVQHLKHIYQGFPASCVVIKGFEEYKTTSILEASENAKHNKPRDEAVPAVISNAIQACGISYLLIRERHTLEPMADVEEHKQKPLSAMKILFETTEKYDPKGINDTLLPARWNVYNSLYKQQQSRHKYRQGKHFEEYMDMIDIGNEDTSDHKEKQMRVEVTAVLKLQQAFHQWMYNYVSTKVQELKKSLHDKSTFEKVLAGKKVEEKMPIEPKVQSNNICTSMPGDIEELDTLVDNPAKNLTCCLCKQKGERKLSGRLIPFQGSLYVHVNCALWSSEVFETSDGALINFYFAYKRSKSIKCIFCGKGGASLSCNAKKYHANYHFICAVSQQVAFLPSKSTYCKQCAKNKGVTLGFPPELNQKRRLYIVKNTTPCSGPNDLSKPGMIERWRPFGYESFNRIGNLTVVRLNKRLDRILLHKYHEAALLTELDGYVGLRISWNIYDPRDPQSGLPFFNSKGYYLYSGTGAGTVTVKAYAKASINIIKPYMPSYLVLGRTPEIEPMEAKEVAEKDAREMWSDWLLMVKKHLPKFTLENIALNANEFVGITKFPVSAWHSLNSKNADAVLYNSSQTEAMKTASGASKRDPNAPKQNYAMFVGELKEEVFDGIVRINDEIGNKSTKYIAYKRAQASPFMGKIGVRDAGPPVPPQNPAKLPKRGKPKEILYESKNVKTNVKDVDLPIAMKYRNYRHMPKKIEVAPSRIHKNGLFATDEYWFLFV